MRLKVIRELYAHFKTESDSLTTSLKNLKVSIDKTYELYHLMLRLVVEVAAYAEERLELARQKKLPTSADLNPNRRFVDNVVVRQIAQSKVLDERLKQYDLGWENDPELIKTLYSELVESDLYKRYMNANFNSYKNDMQVVDGFYYKIVAENEQIEDVLEERSILWADDLDFVIIMVLRTVSMCRPSQKDLRLLPEFKNESDERFARELFTATLTGYREYMDDVEDFTKNWDVERIAFLDSLIMVTAIAEFLNFPSIPVKVTMDEFLEIAKHYSTLSSSIFINGVLDKVVDKLQAAGRIDKIGRGLL